MKIVVTAGIALFLSAGTLAAQRPPEVSRDMGGGSCEANVYNCADTPNPLPEARTVWLEEMTWMDVRDAVAAGKTTIIVPTGGIEPNGPWLVAGKHNYVLHANCEAIARRLGNALCAPVIPYVPEGDIDPPSGHMVSPSTISARVETFEAVLTDVARSLRMHGFENIVFIGDSGGNQGPQRAVADRLTREWGGSPVIAHVQEYYDYASVSAYMLQNYGLVEEADGLHDDAIISLNMFADDPRSIRWAERVEAGLATINGVSLVDRVQTLELARAVVAFRAEATGDAVQAALANGGTLPEPPRPPRPARTGGGGGAQRPQPDPRDMGGGACADSPYNCAASPNPLPRATTMWLEEMTWMDVRDALAVGTKTAIIPTGGIEVNGPWLALGKHNYILRANCAEIARQLGDALCAPIVKWVPEGDIEPQSGHMRSPGTISMRAETFEALLEDIAESLRVHGFENIVLIGDSGGNQVGQAAVAARLNARWNGSARAFHVEEYYTATEAPKAALVARGLFPADAPGSDGLHDEPVIMLNMMATDPASVRWAERVQAGQAVIDGFSIEDLPTMLILAREVSEIRSAQAVEVIRSRIGGM